jgi:hypothetical protein
MFTDGQTGCRRGETLKAYKLLFACFDPRVISYFPYIISVGLLSFFPRLTFYLETGESRFLRMSITTYKSVRRHINQNINLKLKKQNWSAKILQGLKLIHTYMHEVYLVWEYRWQNSSTLRLLYLLNFKSSKSHLQQRLYETMWVSTNFLHSLSSKLSILNQINS